MRRTESQKAIQTLKYYAKNLGIFPNLEQIGSYDDFSQTVLIDYLDKESFFQIFQEFQDQPENNLEAKYESITQFYSTCIHELTHWLDHTSTLWGQRQLVLIYNAINAWTNQNENDFWRIILANSERRRARLATYYTEEYKVEQQESIITPWQYTFGSGLEFGIDGRPRPDRPFVFTIFSNFIGERLCRVPFSVFSLTESNATHAELKVKGQALTLLNENSRLVEQSHLESKIRQNLYNSKLAIYSVATHCLANCIELDEVLKAYELSSALATFCLNLSKTLFDSLIEPEEFSIWQYRTKSLKELADPGFAFLTITKKAAKYHNSLSVED